MNRLLQSVCVACVLTVLNTCPGWSGAVPGSDRPVAAQNFNRLIQTNSCPGCDLAGVVLTRVDLSGANLAGANLAGAKLNLANLSGANLSGANLQGASLGGADLANADLTGANLTGAILQGAYLKGAKLDGKITSAAEGETAGEDVFVADEAKPKHTPYTQQDVLVKKQRDLDRQEAAKQLAVTPTSPVSTPVMDEQKAKEPVLIADAVVPVEHETMQTTEQQEEVPEPILLDETSKQPVQIAPVSMEQSEQPVPASVHEQNVAPTGVDAHSAVHDMIAQIEADAPKKETKAVPAVEKEPMAISDAKDEVDNADTSPQTLSSKKDQHPGAEVVPAATAAVAAVANTAAAAADKLVYTVETPAQAMAKKMLLVEKLLDDEACMECDLAGVDLSGKDLEGADLERANLAGANLAEADLSEANLKGANLSGANLRDADLSEADLYKADLSGADLTGADLTDALTDSADFTGAIGVPASVQSP